MHFHTMYGAVMPPLRKLEEPKLSLFSLKWERHSTGDGSDALDFVDAVALSGERIVTVPFIRIIGGRIIFPEAAVALGTAVLAALETAVRAWFEQKATDSQPPVIDTFAHDPLLTEVLQDEHPGNAIVPGLVLHSQLFAAAEPYRHAAPQCANRHVADLNPGSGYGASLLRGRAASYTAVASTERDRLLCERLSYIESIERVAPQADVVLALGQSADEVGRTASAALACKREGGRAYLSARGSAGGAALAKFGEPSRLTALGGEAAEMFDEFFIALEPASEFARTNAVLESGSSTAPRPLSVLFVLRDSANQVFGGDVVQVRETAAALRRRGHRVDVTTDARPCANGYDVVELSNLTAGPITLEQARAVEDFTGPIVMMPIFTDHADETTWGMHAATIPFRMAEDSLQLAEWLHKVAQREFAMNGIMPPPARVDHYAGATQQQREMLARVDFLAANALSEVHRIFRFLQPGIPFAIVPSCANPQIYGTDTAKRFKERYELGDFVVVTGRFEPRKNQLLLFEAARRMPDRTFLCIGKNYEQDFGRLVRRYCPGNVLILPHMPEVELAGAYAAARVAALPAWDEVVSLSCLNAAISGPSLVLTRNSYEHEYALDDAEYCDPGDCDSIVEAINRAWENHDERHERRLALAQRVRRDFNWDRAAELSEAIYYRLLADNPRGAERLRRFSKVPS